MIKFHEFSNKIKALCLISELALGSLFVSSAFSSVAAINLVTNGGFEDPILPDGNNYSPSGATWNFQTYSAISRPGNIFPIKAVEGGQYGFIQSCCSFDGSNNVGAISQQISGMTVGNQYQLSFFSVSGVNNYGTPALPFSVSLDSNTLIDSYTPGLDWNTTITTFSATNSTATLTFQGTSSSGNLVSILDDIQVTSAVPVPWDIDSLPMVFTSLLFGLSVWLKSKKL